ncbi:conserved hypothetical protein [Talaromyces stipitatus ATCC 10500]|uniref:Uncharacterized protein n=1 Tax=Talaromyces stipitatus (strain ATCC 10500 / CBS 375.48 / QM 6759 / NRRL 1006) TaxID=441959 RepID=B8MJ82_TALSN|nr:uncharacterized protein TSTA_041490 [Talaromyces stipitatus ATCC 10500]EED14671.1 conserved hypothetical protein [Talaromyces stipitatus ATCC 10500]
MAVPTTITTSTTSAIRALTTTFTPAVSCLTDLYLYHVVSGGTVWDYRQLGPSPTSDCYPPNFTPTSSAYYSPGVCPTLYSIACSNVVSIGTVTETRATCCPSCQTFTDGWPWYSTELCTYAATGTSTFLLTDTSTISTSTGAPNFNAYGIQIRWQESDTSTPNAASATTTASSPLSTSPSPVSTSTPTPTSSSLSTGAKAGIGIGAGLGALLILAGVIFFGLRHRRNRAAKRQESVNMHFASDQSQQQQQYYVEAAAGDVRGKQPYHELSAQSREKAPVELSSESWK